MLKISIIRELLDVYVTASEILNPLHGFLRVMATRNLLLGIMHHSYAVPYRSVFHPPGLTHDSDGLVSRFRGILDAWEKSPESNGGPPDCVVCLMTLECRLRPLTKSMQS